MDAPTTVGQLDYEPRAVHSCACGRTWVGTKGGRLYLIPAGADATLMEEHFPRSDGAVMGIRGVWGCDAPGHPDIGDPTPCLIVVDGTGRLRVRRAGAWGAWSAPVGRPWAFAIDRTSEGPEVIVLASNRTERFFGLDGLDVEELAPRGGRPLGQHLRWLIATTPPGVTPARYLGVTPEGHHFELKRQHGAGGWETVEPKGKLDLPPLCVTVLWAAGPGSSACGFAYGFDQGARYVRFGSPQTAEIELMGGPRIVLIREVQFFGDRRLILASDERQIWSSRWHPSETSLGRPAYPVVLGWKRWGTIASNAMDVVVPPASEHGEHTSAIMLLRTHEVARSRVWDWRKLRRNLSPEALGEEEASGDAPSDAADYVRATIGGPIAGNGRIAVMRHLFGIADQAKGPLGVRGVMHRVDTMLRGLWSIDAQRRGIHPEAGFVSELVLVLATLMARSVLVDGVDPRRLAERQRDVLLPSLDLIAKIDPSPLLALWLGFLRKYYREIASFLEKEGSDADLIRANSGRPSADALLYAARLALRGHDQLASVPLASPVWAFGTREVEGGGELSATLMDGTVIQWRVERQDPMCERRQLIRTAGWMVLPKGADRPGRPPGNYSRVIMDHAGKWYLAPKEPTQEGPPSRFALIGGSRSPVLDCFAIAAGRKEWLFGLSKEPGRLQQASSLDAAPRGVQLVGKARLPLHRGHEPERCRVWFVGHLDGRSYVVAGEDGVLMVGRLRDAPDGALQFRVDDFAAHPSSVRSGVVIPRGARPMVVVGTTDGEVFAYRVLKGGKPRAGQKDASGPGASWLALSFRDLLRAPVRSVFLLRETGHCDVVVVMEETGRLTGYEIPPSGDGGSAGGPGFLGRRVFQVTVEAPVGWFGGAGSTLEWTAAAPAGDGLIAVAGWDQRSRRGGVVLVRVGATAIQRELVVEQALAYVQQWLAPRGRDRVWTRRTAALILSSVPAVRGAIPRLFVKAEVAHLLRDWDRRTPTDRTNALREQMERALGGPIGGRPLAKAMFNAIGEMACYPRLGSAARDVAMLLFEPTLLHRFRDETLLVAALARKLLTRQRLKDWLTNAPAQAPPDHWMSALLLHHDRVVRVVALQQLAEILYEDRRNPEGERLFAATAEAPALLEAGPLVDLLVRYLAAHPPTGHGPEGCDVGTWTATIVLLHVLRALEDSVWVVLDLLSIREVHPVVFELLQTMVNPIKDGRIAAKIREDESSLRPGDGGAAVALPPLARGYWPTWRWGLEPSIGEVRRWLGLFDGPSEAPDEDLAPDACFDHARRTVYACILDLAKAGDEEEMDAALKRIPRIGSGWPPASPSWLAGLRAYGRPSHQARTGERGFFSYTADWLSSEAGGRRRGNTLMEHVHALNVRLQKAATEPEAGAPDAPRPLFEPELGMLRAVFSDWEVVLRGALPREGEWYRDYQLGSGVDGSRSVFEVVGEPKLLIRVEPRPSKSDRNAIVGRWRTMMEAQGNGRCARIPKIKPILMQDDKVTDSHRKPRVFHRGTHAAMVMNLIDGKALTKSWREVVREATRRSLVAQQVLRDIGSALHDLHNLGLVHGDVHPRNIVLTQGASPQAWLVDLGHTTWSRGPVAGSPDHEPGVTVTQLAPYSGPLWFRDVLRSLDWYSDSGVRASGAPNPSVKPGKGEAGDVLALVDLVLRLACGQAEDWVPQALERPPVRSGRDRMWDGLWARIEEPGKHVWTMGAVLHEFAVREERVFVAYQGPDHDQATELAKAVTEHFHCEVTVHDRAAYAGRRPGAELDAALDAATTIVFLVGSTVGRHRYFHREVKRAVARQSEALRPRIVPVLLPDVADGKVPKALREYQWFRWDEVDQVAKVLFSTRPA